MRLCLLLLCFAAFCAACAAKTTTRVEDFNEFGDREESYSAETSLFVSKEKAQFEAAKVKERQGDFKGAIQILEGLRLDADLDDQMRQDVLLSLGEMYGAWMNAFKDYETGRARLQQLLADFPETQHRLRAEELLQKYARILEQE